MNQEFQLGYVYDSWNSNFVYHGDESRIPLSYRLKTDNFSCQLSTAFLMGNYRSDAVSGGSSSEFSSQDLSDTLLRSTLSLPMGGVVSSSFVGSLNIPTGNTQWESNAARAAVPYIFDPSYYHGRGFGFDLFYVLTSNGQGTQWGAGLGYMRTNLSDSGAAPDSDLVSWGAVVGMACLGLSAGKDEQFNFRIDQSIPLAASPAFSYSTFTLGQSTQFSGQWSKKIGGDRLQVTASYGLYGQGLYPDLTGGGIQTAETTLGDQVRIRPFLAWAFGPGVAMETGLHWLHIFATGSDTSAQFYNGGGDLYGALQSVTFQLDSASFLNVAAEYDYIYTLNSAYADAANTVLTNVGYNKFLLGTNVGFKW